MTIFIKTSHVASCRELNLERLKKESQYYPPTKSTVYMRMYIDNSITIFYRNHPIKYEEIQ
jgi:hypothetical protein